MHAFPDALLTQVYGQKLMFAVAINGQKVHAYAITANILNKHHD